MRIHYNLGCLLLFLLTSISTFAQSNTITGTVSDTDGMPLPGVNVIVKGTNNGVQTDFDGEYSIKASEGDVLVFSFVGMITAEITVQQATTIDATLEQNTAQLDEVVVTAVGSRPG